MYKKNHANNISSILFICVSVAVIVLFYFYPMINAFMLSFQSGKGTNLSFSGLDNYIRLFADPNFKSAFLNTISYLVVQVPLMLVLGIFIAVLLNDPKLKFKSFFRSAIFLPCVTSLIAYSTIFKYLFTEDGLVNKFLSWANIISVPIPWLTDAFWAKVIILIAITWRWTGYNMIFFLSGLQNIDTSIYEAASIDGASSVKQFTKITIPLLKPIILFTGITSTIGTLQLFDEVRNIANGDPGSSIITISAYIYNVSFKYVPEFGYAAAMSFVIVIMIVLLSFIQLKLGGDQND